MFIKNTWYVACTLSELEGLRDRPLGRTICNEKMVFFQGPEGRAVAVEDFCPHRGAPLSLGKVCEGKLQCGYHGLMMGADGKAVEMPMQRVRGFPSVKSYPVVERHGFVWVWPGDPLLADPTQVPHFAFFANRLSAPQLLYIAGGWVERRGGLIIAIALLHPRRALDAKACARLPLRLRIPLFRRAMMFPYSRHGRRIYNIPRAASSIRLFTYMYWHCSCSSSRRP